MIIFLKHVDIEGPETFETFLKDKGFETRIIGLYNGEPLPNNLDNIEAVVSLGGPMNVYEEEKYSFLKDEHLFIQEIVEQEIPFVGICLGSQILAKAQQARVVKSSEKEVGFSSIELTQAGMEDPLFQGIDKEFEVYQWHEDMSEIPKEGYVLASSAKCPHQAFKVGPKAYGLQFHIEITDTSIQEWSDRYLKDDEQQLIKEKEKMLKDYALKKESFNQNAIQIYKNFIKIISANKVNI